jgi:hypothetical protein
MSATVLSLLHFRPEDSQLVGVSLRELSRVNQEYRTEEDIRNEKGYAGIVGWSLAIRRYCTSSNW